MFARLSHDDIVDAADAVAGITDHIWAGDGDTPDGCWVELPEDDPRVIAWRAAHPRLLPVWEVLRLTVLDRLRAAGLWGAARAAMQAGDGVAWDRWLAAVALRSDDAEVRALLVSIGADPDQILAL